MSAGRLPDLALNTNIKLFRKTVWLSKEVAVAAAAAAAATAVVGQRAVKRTFRMSFRTPGSAAPE